VDKRLLEKDILVFDVGNVLVRFDPKIIAKGFFKPEKAQQLFSGVFESGLWPLIDTGLINTGALARLMCEAAHTDDIRDYLTVCDLLDNFCEHECALKMSEQIPALKAMGKRLYYLSNYATPAFERTMARFPFFSLFDGGVVSSHEHVCKPAPRIFQILCERYGFQPHDALFIDDTLSNIEAARREGFAVWHYLDGLTEAVDD